MKIKMEYLPLLFLGEGRGEVNSCENYLPRTHAGKRQDFHNKTQQKYIVPRWRR